MNLPPSDPRPPRGQRGWPLLLIAALAIGMLLSACDLIGISFGDGSSSGSGASASRSASPSSSASASDRDQQMLAYSQCMRDNGVPDFPDPAPGGVINLTGEFDVNSPTFRAADEVCASLLPPPPADGERDEGEAREQMLAYAACMRENGVPNFPDPQPGQGIDLNGDVIDIDSPAFRAAMEACASVPGAPGGTIDAPTAPGGSQP